MFRVKLYASCMPTLHNFVLRSDASIHLQTHSAMAGRIPGAQLPLFLLQRGALAAAVAASSALDQALAQGAYL